MVGLERLREYGRLIRLDRPIGIYLLLWPTLWALWLAAEGWPPIDLLAIFVAGVVLMRSAGCAINDYADRHIDAHVARTRDRPLAQGRLHPNEALGVFAVLSLLAFLLVLQTNAHTVALAGVGVLLAASYPFMKRFHSLPQVHLGVAFAWAVPMAFTAVQDRFPEPLAWWLFATTVVWTVIYDTFYGMADRDEDRRIGVRSTALLLGDWDRAVTAFLQVLLLLGLVQVGRLAGFTGTYWLGVGGAVLFMLYQQGLIRQRAPAACLRAFRNNHWLGMVVWVGLFLEAGS